MRPRPGRRPTQGDENLWAFDRADQHPWPFPAQSSSNRYPCLPTFRACVEPIWIETPAGFVDVTAEEMPRGVRLDELSDRAAAGVDPASNLIQPRVGRRSVANKRQW